MDEYAHVREAFRTALRDFLGPSGLTILEYYLNMKLGEDMYRVLLSSPHLFYDALRSLLGSGAEAILRITATKLIEGGRVSGLSAEEFVELIKSCNEDDRKKLIDSFRW